MTAACGYHESVPKTTSHTHTHPLPLLTFFSSSHAFLPSILSDSNPDSGSREGGAAVGVAGEVRLGVGRAEGSVYRKDGSGSRVLASPGRSFGFGAAGGGCRERTQGRTSCCTRHVLYCWGLESVYGMLIAVARSFRWHILVSYTPGTWYLLILFLFFYFWPLFYLFFCRALTEK